MELGSGKDLGEISFLGGNIDARVAPEILSDLRLLERRWSTEEERHHQVDGEGCLFMFERNSVSCLTELSVVLDSVCLGYLIWTLTILETSRY